MNSPKNKSIHAVIFPTLQQSAERLKLLRMQIECRHRCRSHTSSNAMHKKYGGKVQTSRLEMHAKSMQRNSLKTIFNAKQCCDQVTARAMITYASGT